MIFRIGKLLRHKHKQSDESKELDRRLQLSEEMQRQVSARLKAAETRFLNQSRSDGRG